MLSIGAFVFGLAVVVYVIFGYPALLAILSRFRQAPVLIQPQSKRVTVLLPVHNGAAWLERKLRSILELDYPRELVQVIVISDGSDDGTEEIARSFAPQGVELVSLPRGGKAAALNEGMRRASGEILLLTDVRQELGPDSLSNLVSCFADPKVGVASGELIIRKGCTLEEENVGIYWRYEKWIRKHQSRIDSMLGATGSICAMRACLAAPLAPDTILDDVVLPLGAFFKGYRLILDERARAYDCPTSIQSEFRRKVRTLAGMYQTIFRYPQLLTLKNRMWIHFASQKVGRLLLPWALLLVLFGSFGLPATWRILAVGAHAAFFALVLLDFVVGEVSPLKRVTSPARTVFVLISAAFCAVFYWLMPRRTGWQPTGANAPVTDVPLDAGAADNEVAARR
jgi:biofilm PGA synthesis N-glycosyltransferase PgaC